MRNQRMLLIDQIDRKLKPFKDAENIIIPERGWIHTIRTAMNISLEQIGHKLNITKQGVKKIEAREATESITIKSLKEIANAMEMKLVYGFVPKDGSLENLVKNKAEQLATKIVMRTNHNMKLEGQGTNDEQISKAIKDLTSDLKREMKKSLWD